MKGWANGAVHTEEWICFRALEDEKKHEKLTILITVENWIKMGEIFVVQKYMMNQVMHSPVQPRLAVYNFPFLPCKENSDFVRDP